MNIIRKIFGRRPPESLPDPSSMSIDDAWEEFCRTVRPPGYGLLIHTLKRPEFSAALSWLQPPTNCPMAMATLRAFIDLQRKQYWKDMDNLALVYRGDTEDNLQPPQNSLDAIANFCVFLQISATVFYKTGLSESAEYEKMTITLES